MKKHIFVHLLNDFSGSPKVLSQVITTVQKNDFELALYTGKSKDGFLSGLTDKHHHYFYKRSENKWMTLITFISSQIILFFKLLKYSNKDVLIYVNTMLPFGAGLAGLIMRKPVVYHIHETYLTPPLLKRFLRLIISWSAKKVIFVSNAVNKLESFKNKEQHIIYNSLPQNFTDAVNQDGYDLQNKGGFNVLMISSLKTYKGINEFVSLANSLKTNSKITFTLVLNASKEETENYFNKSTLPANIELVTKQENVTQYYQKSSLVLNLSKVDECVETFGLTILEAMAFGIPVIVPPVGGPAEIVTDGVEGYLMASYDIESIAEKIKALSLDKALWSQLSKNAITRSKYFNEVTFEKNILKVLHD
ncbi:glycosyltransferase [bacterium]|nr:glycosyltransferase [bacterium]